MTRPSVRLLALFSGLLLLGSCVDASAPEADGTAPLIPVGIAVAPVFQMNSASAAAGQISRIRVTFILVPDGTILGTQVVEVDPNASAWDLELSFEIPSSSGVNVELLLELLSVTNGVETTEWSGKSGTIAVGGGSPATVADVPVGRGPPENLTVDAVSLPDSLFRLAEGQSTRIPIGINTTDGAVPTALWTSLSPGVVSVDNTGLITGLVPGEARIVAEAGTRADTARVSVASTPSGVRIAPDTLKFDRLPAQANFSAQVVDARGNPMTGESVVWTTPDANRLENLGGGIFRVLGAGTSRVVATASASSALADTSFVVLNLVEADVSVRKTVDRASALPGDTVVFTVIARNDGPAVAGGVSVQDTLDAGFTLISASASRGAFTGTTWTIGALQRLQEDTLRLRVRIDPSRTNVTLRNAARIRASELNPDPVPGNNRAEATVAVGERTADLGITKRGPGTAFQFDTITFEVVVRNAGPEALQTVAVRETLGDGLTFLNATPRRGTFDRNTLVWTVGAMPSGKADTLQVRAIVDDQTAGRTLANRVEATAGSAPGTPVDRNTANNSSVALVEIEERVADIQVTKEVDRAAAVEGDTVRFRVVVRNRGPDAAQNVSVIDEHDEGFRILDATRTRGTIDEATGIWTVGDLPAGRADTLLIRARIEPGAANKTITNRARARALERQRDPEASNNAASASVVVSQRLIDLEIQGKGPAGPIFETDTVRIQGLLINRGPGTANNIITSGRIDAGVTFLAAIPEVGIWEPGLGTWTVPTLAPGDTARILLVGVIQVGQVGKTINANFRIESFQGGVDPVAANNGVSLAVQPSGVDVEIGKTVDRSAASEGEEVVFTITAKNNSPTTLKNVQVRDTLPTGLGTVSATPSSGSFTSGIWTIPTLTSGSSATLTIRASIGAGTAGKNLVNEAQRFGTIQTDTFPSNDAAQASVTVSARTADLSLQITADKPTPHEGELVTYTVQVTNKGPFPVTNVVTSGALPTGITYVSATPATGTWDEPSGKWTVANLAVNQTVSLTMIGTVDLGRAKQQLATQFQITSFDGAVESASADNQATANVNVLGADLQLTKTAVLSTVVEGGVVQFKIIATNPTARTLTNITIGDTLPVGMSESAHSATQGTYSAGVWAIPSILAGKADTLTVDALIALGRGGSTLTNYAHRLGMDQTDTLPSNDNDQAAVTVTARTTDLAVTGSIDKSTAFERETVTLSGTITNNGPNAVTNVIVGATAGAGITFSTSTPPTGVTWNAATREWTIASLAVSASVALSVQGVIAKGQAGTTLATIMQIKSFVGASDSNAGNNSFVAPVTVRGVDLEVTKSADVATAVNGQSVAFKVIAKNNSPFALDSVMIFDTLPTGFSGASQFPQAGTTYSAGTWLIPSLAVGKADTLEVTATVSAAAGSTLTNTASLTSIVQTDTFAANNSAAASVSVSAAAPSLTLHYVGNTPMTSSGYATQPSVPHQTVPGGVLAGVSGLSVTSLSTITTFLGGSVQMEADGDFIYTPPLNSRDNDSFTYATDVGGSGTVNLTYSGNMVWYVNSSAGTTGNGTALDPFDQLGDLNAGLAGAPPAALTSALYVAPAAVNPGAGDYIYLHGGGSNYSTGHALQTNQKMIGAGVALVVTVNGSPTTLAAVGTRPVISGVGTGLTLASGAVVKGIKIENPGIDGISAGAGVSGATIDSVTITGAARHGIEIRSTAGTINSTGLIVRNSVEANILLSNASATVNLTGAQVNDSTDNRSSRMIQVSGGAPTLVYSGSVHQNFGLNGFAFLQVDSTGAGTSVQLRGGPFTAKADSVIRIKDMQGTVRADSISIVNGSGVGVEITNSSGTVDLNVLDVNTPNLKGVIVSGGGPNVQIDLAPSSLTTSGSVRPVEILNTSGAVIAFTGGPITGPAGIKIDNVDDGGSTSSVSFANTITITNPASGNSGIEVTNSTADVSFSGPVTVTASTGYGIYGSANQGGTLSFTGTGSTVTHTHSASSAIHLEDTPIGVAGATFEKVSSNGGRHGMFLRNTGTGPISVTGSGTTDGSGGVIQNTTSHAVIGDTIGAITLKNITITHPDSAGVILERPGGTLLENVDIALNLTGNEFDGIFLRDPTADSYIKNLTIDFAGTDTHQNQLGIYTEVTSGTRRIDVDGVTVTDFANTEQNGQAIEGRATGTGDFTFSVKNSTVDRNNYGVVAIGDNSANMTLIVDNNVIRNGNVGVEIVPTLTSNVTYELTSNRFSLMSNHDILAISESTGTVQGGVRNNLFGQVGDGGPGGSTAALITSAAASPGIMRVKIDNNTINSSSDGLIIGDGLSAGVTGTQDYIVTNNVVTSASNRFPIWAQLLDNASTICTNVTGNSVTADYAGYGAIWLEKDASRFNAISVAGLAAGNQTAATTTAFLIGANSGTNTGVSGTLALATDGASPTGFNGVASCTAPTLPSGN